jgi:hypothetical protein
VVLKRDLAFLDEDLADVVVAGYLARALALTVGLGLREPKTPDDEDDGGAGTEPKQWTPAVGRSIDEAT